MVDLNEDGAAVRTVASLPRELAAFRRFLSYVGKAEIVIAMELAATVVLSTSQAFLRYTFGTSLWWSGEIVQYAVFSTYFFGISYAFKTRQYILIEFVSAMAPPKLQPSSTASRRYSRSCSPVGPCGSPTSSCRRF